MGIEYAISAGAIGAIALVGWLGLKLSRASEKATKYMTKYMTELAEVAVLRKQVDTLVRQLREKEEEIEILEEYLAETVGPDGVVSIFTELLQNKPSDPN